ncbi:hypothetical protein MHYP_G00209510 [Metynnis hypsauchen]
MIDFSSPLTHLLWFHFRAKDRYLLITFSRHAPELGWREDPVLIFLGAQSELVKASNLQCHFTSLHANVDQEVPKGTELRKHKLNTLKCQSDKQTQLFQKLTKQSEIATLASYQLAWNIAHAKKPYSEG